MKYRRQLAAITCLLVLASNSLCQVAAPTKKATADAAKQKEAKQKKDADSIYLRLLRDKHDDPVAMQTSVVSFTKRETGKPDIVVDLIGAVHVADKSYFKQLNRLFTKYDALLYELVAPEDNNVPVGGTSQHPVGQMQQGMKSMLDLSYQLEEVDYRKKNFVHADMSPNEFAQVMSDRNESWLQMMMRMMGSALATANAKGKGSDADLLLALFSSDRPLRLKRVMSTQFSDLEASMSALNGPDGGSTIIGQRNKKCLEVLSRELAKGKKRIGIFYGAGHMPNMEERLAQQFGLYPNKDSVKWMTAWDMKGKK